MNILVLHHFNDNNVRRTSILHGQCFEKYRDEHSYYYRDICDDVTDEISKIDFDVIIIDTTALCIRYFRPRDLFFDIINRNNYIKNSHAVKIAFPQDDNDHSDLLDHWLALWKIDIIYTVYYGNKDTVYKLSSLHAHIIECCTGYVDDTDIEIFNRYSLPYEKRNIDISYRARDLPPQFGRYGQLKAGIGRLVEKAGRGTDLRLDISSDPSKVILGEDWLHFLGNSRWCLGSEGGSSLLDRFGIIRDRCELYLKNHENADFDEVEKACFPLLDGIHRFSCPSPRLFEAAMMRCGQILVEAPYYDVLKPYTHYIPLDPGGTNLNDVLELCRDSGTYGKMTEACYEDLILSDNFRYSTHVNRVFNDIDNMRIVKNNITIRKTTYRRFNNILNYSYFFFIGWRIIAASKYLYRSIKNWYLRLF